MKRVKMEDWICRTEGLPRLTREDLELLQLKKLNHMLTVLRQRGGIYEGLPAKLDRLEQLSQLPFTTPEMLRSHPGQFLTCSQSQVSRIISEATSGTTGGAKRVFYSQNDLSNTVDFFASGISEMLNPGEKCLIAFPFSGPSGLGDLIAAAVRKLGAVPVRPVPFDCFGSLLRQIREEAPETYIGFSVPLLSLKRLYSGDFPIQRALLSGDSCPDGVLDALEMPVFPHYGSRETALGGAVTCQAFEGMHLRENHIIAEIIDSRGRVLPRGSWGELVITTIGMEAMPLLRYRTGDYTRILPEPCPCGGVTLRLDRVTRKERSPVSMEALDSLLFPIPGLIDFRAAYGDHLQLEASATASGVRDRIEAALLKQFPRIHAEITVKSASSQDRPAYPGKRRILKEGFL